MPSASRSLDSLHLAAIEKRLLRATVLVVRLHGAAKVEPRSGPYRQPVILGLVVIAEAGRRLPNEKVALAVGKAVDVHDIRAVAGEGPALVGAVPEIGHGALDALPDLADPLAVRRVGNLVNPRVDGDYCVARVEVVKLVEVNLVASDDAGEVGGGEGAVVRPANVFGPALAQPLGEDGELLWGESALAAVTVLVHHRVENLLGEALGPHALSFRRRLACYKYSSLHW